MYQLVHKSFVKSVSLRHQSIQKCFTPTLLLHQRKYSNNDEGKRDHKKQKFGQDFGKKKSKTFEIVVGSLLVGVPLAIYWLKPEGGGVVEESTSPDKSNLFTQFQNPSLLYKNKSTSDIYFSLFIYKLCTQEWLVDAGLKILKFSEQSELLRRTIEQIVKKSFYKQFCAGETYEETLKTVNKLKKQGISVILDYCNEDSTNSTEWKQNTETVLSLIQQAHSLGANFIPLKVTSFIHPSFLEHMTSRLNNSSNKLPLQLSQNEIQEYNNLMERLNIIVKTAKDNNIKILMDAEQSYRQPAIDYIALELSKKFNKTSPILFNTYQCYLKDTPRKLNNHLDLAKKEKFYLGVKLVRGAYIVSETERAIKMGYTNPITSSKIETDHNYNSNVTLLLDRLTNPQNNKIGIVFATHNLESVLWACQKIRQFKLPPDHPNVSFGQLYGMGDYLTYGLNDMNFNANKLIPYGPVKAVIPYLTRRAQENRDVLGGTMTERHLLWLELKNRKFGFAFLNTFFT